MTGSLEAKDIVLNYGQRPILRGVSVTVRPGEIVALIGANGAGKSSLLKTMAGLISPTAGSVSLRGRAINSIDRRALGREVAYLPQERAVHWPLSVRQLVALGRLPHRDLIAGTTHEDAQAIDDAITAMGILHLAERPAYELSGGERARALLARALAQQARFLVADEPSAGLDPAHELMLFAQFVKIAAKQRGVIIALHDLSLAARFCDRALLLQCGTTIAEGEPGAVLTPERLAEGFGIRAKVAEIDGWPIVVPLEPLN